jgi:hypothetical protein
VGDLGKLEATVAEFVFEFWNPAGKLLSGFTFGLLELTSL